MKPVTTLKEARRAVKLGSTPVKHDYVLDPDSVGQTIVEDNFYHFQEFANSKKFNPRNKIYNKTMLDFAAECGSFQIFDWLLEKDTKVTDNTCVCALRGGNIEIIKLCRRMTKFDFGAYINVAVNYRMNDAVDWIIKNYPRHEAISIWDAAQADNIEAVFYCISHGVPVDSTDFQGWTPLHRACQYGQEESCKFLIKKGANIAARNLQICYFYINLLLSIKLASMVIRKLLSSFLKEVPILRRWMVTRTHLSYWLLREVMRKLLIYLLSQVPM